MENNTQARKWALVINNPLEAGLDHAAIREILRRFAPSYFCMADEIATTGTYHTHIFLLAPSPRRGTLPLMGIALSPSAPQRRPMGQGFGFTIWIPVAFAPTW